jgi:hypothetical protein
MNIESWFLGSRKFIIMLAVILFGIVFRVCGWIDGAQVTDLIKMVGISFMGCNSVEHMCMTAKDWIAAQVANNDGSDPK